MSLLRTFATPLTIASFITLGTTGILMLLGSHGAAINSAHEISSIVFGAGSVLHIAVNFKPTLAHLRRPLGAALALIFVAITVYALVHSGDRKGNPRKAFMQASEVLLNLTPGQIASASNVPQGQVIKGLNDAGFQVADPHATLRSIALASHREPFDAIASATRDIPVRDHH